MASKKNNMIRDINLSVIAGALIVFVTMFGMKQCSGCDDKDDKDDKETPKIEIVNENFINCGGKTTKNNTTIIINDSVKIKNSNSTVGCGDCGKKQQTQQKKKQQQQKKQQPKVVHDTVYVKLPCDSLQKDSVKKEIKTDTVPPCPCDSLQKDTVKQYVPKKGRLAYGYVATIGTSKCR